MNKYAVIVAGGSGLRMGVHEPKQFLLLHGKPVLWHTITAFLDAYADLEIVVVLPSDHMARGCDIIQQTKSPSRIVIAAGGPTRFHSVQNGLLLVPPQAVVFVHDGVRCLITPALIQRCYEATLTKGNAIPAVSPVDSIRIETVKGNEVIDRSKVRIIQTPQTFVSDIILGAFRQEYDESFTDEAGVVEKTGVTIHLIEGEISNIKITRPIDLLVAEKILEDRESGI